MSKVIVIGGGAAGMMAAYAAGMCGLALFPSDENVVAWTGESCAQGLNLFSSDAVCDQLEDYLKGVLS